MRIPGQRIKRTRLIQTDKYVVAIEVEMVIPVDDPCEPCYESETIHLLREIKEHAERDDGARSTLLWERRSCEWFGVEGKNERRGTGCFG